MLVEKIKLGPYEIKIPAVCGAVKASSPPQMMRSMKKAFREGADLVEFRIDGLRKTLGWERLLKGNKPVILTNRPKREGGDFAGEERERVDFLFSGIQLGAPCVDLEFSTPKELRNSVLSEAREVGVTVILSHHDFLSTPKPTELAKKAREMEKTGCDLLKLVTFARGRADAYRMLEFVARAQGELKKPLIAFAMGEQGVITRFIGPILGVPLVYAAVDAKTAPGQPSLRVVKSLLMEFGGR